MSMRFMAVSLLIKQSSVIKVILSQVRSLTDLFVKSLTVNYLIKRNKLIWVVCPL